MKRKELILVLIVLIIMIVSICAGLYYALKHKSVNHSEIKKASIKTNFDYDILKEVNKNYKNTNYLISPYSMKIALSMVRDGANGDTKTQIENLIGNENITLLNSEKRISTANGLFVKNEYKNDILESYYETMKKNYDGEILYGDFTTPKDINDWIYKKTYEMIKDPIQDINPEFVLGIVNAIAIDVEWQNEFKCNSTYNEEFIKANNEKIEVEMMHNAYNRDAKYFDTSEEKGVILPYKTYARNGEESQDGISLEFVGILPNKSLDEYIESFDKDTLSRIESSANEVNDQKELLLGLPRFEYSFEFTQFKDSLINLGMKDAFSHDKADFSNIINTKDIYISDAIHDTYIKLGETGTKAAAVTAFMFETSSIREEKENIEIKFNKPFMYLIREKGTNNILFIGTVYEPNTWKGSTCEGE